MASYKRFNCLHKVILVILLSSFIFLTNSLPNYDGNSMNNHENNDGKQSLGKFYYYPYVYGNLYPASFPKTNKRAVHNIETRSVNEFNNCYFSPIQCVMDKRKRK
uniref:COesterase domain-containing protein n=1 Tax=Parastrongyloides trichosuri TaxID=131310 RepID=A0A0N4ZR48_PARTI